MNTQPVLLFVCGFPSGGTDLAKNVLNAHPDIVITGEIPKILDLHLLGYNRDTVLTNAQQASEAIVQCQQLDNWHNLHTDKVDLQQIEYPIDLSELLKKCITLEAADIIGSKTPQFSENIERLENLFPSAHYLFITRDIRDICLSWNRKWGKDYLLCANRWAERTTRCLASLAALPDERSLVISYENLVTNTDAVCREICTFLNLPYSERMPSYHKYITDVIDGKLKYGEPIDTSNTSKWKTQLTSKQACRIEQIAFDAMHQTGYEVTLAKSMCKITKLEKYRGLLKDLSAIILVGNRAAENNGLLSRVNDVKFEIQKYWRKFLKK